MLNFPYNGLSNEYGVVGEDNIWYGVIYQVHNEFGFDPSDSRAYWMNADELAAIIIKIKELNAQIE